MRKKYELTGETLDVAGTTLRRIRALRAIPSMGVALGDVGGWAETEKNLDHEGSAWVYGEARVSGGARVYGDARVYGEAQVYGDARVYGGYVYG